MAHFKYRFSIVYPINVPWKAWCLLLIFFHLDVGDCLKKKKKHGVINSGFRRNCVLCACLIVSKECVDPYGRLAANQDRAPSKPARFPKATGESEKPISRIDVIIFANPSFTGTRDIFYFHRGSVWKCPCDTSARFHRTLQAVLDLKYWKFPAFQEGKGCPW